MIQITDNYRHLLKRYERYAPRYDRKFARYTQQTLNKAIEVIPLQASASLLDVACGTGALIERLIAQRPNLRVTGVDISPEMLKQAQRRMPASDQIQWKVATAERLPASDHKFDVITCTNAFHLVQNAQAALAEFLRVLKPGGKLVLVDWCRDFTSMRLLDVFHRFADRQKRTVRTVSQMRGLLTESGFEVLEAERFVPNALWGLMRIVAQPQHS